MRRVYVIPVETFNLDGTVFASEKDGGDQLNGVLNDEKGTVDFPQGTVSGAKAFSVPQDKFIETSERQKLIAENKSLKDQLAKQGAK